MYNNPCMEEGGESTKKNPGIPLDWDALFRNTEEAAPPQLVVEKPKKRKSLPELQNGDDQEESTEGRFKELGDKELGEAIERQKRLHPSASLKLPDKGEKLWRRITRMEVELLRRQSEKDNAKRENLPKSHDLKYLGAHDGNQKVTPYQANNDSTFAASFRKKMENPTENVYGNELSTLNSCGHQKLITGRHDLSGRRRKGSFTLRQTQFISPGNLSLRGDQCLLWKDDSKRRHFVTASPSCSKDRVATKCSDKLNYPEAQASYDRRKHDTFILVDLDEPEEAEMVPEVDEVDECLKDSRIYYPSSDDAESVEIRYSDLDCLGPEAYLTSTIINFYIRYLQRSKSSLSEQADNFHFFNTYFYNKLSEALQENDNGSSFSKIRRWWKGVKLFEKSYIFLPIHEQSHWSLIIICIPEKEEGVGPIILHLDSLGFHYSKLIFGNIRRLLIGEWKFMVKEDPDPCLPFLRRIQDNFHRSFEEKKVEVPQQKNEYDCGVFVLFFIERFIEMAPKRMKEEDLAMFGSQWFKPAEASRLRVTIRKILKDEFKKAKEHNCLLDA